MPGRRTSTGASIARLLPLPHLDGQLRDTPGELRLRFGTDRLDHRRAEVDADIGGLVRREDAELRVLDPPLRHLLVVDEERALAALGRAPAVVREVVPQHRLARGDLLRAGNRCAL